MKNITYLILGILFGVVLTKSEVISWFRINDMFMLREAHMYLVIGSAVLVGAISVALLKIFKLKSVNGETINFKGKQYHKGFIIGGAIFGIGWAITHDAVECQPVEVIQYGVADDGVRDTFEGLRAMLEELGDMDGMFPDDFDEPFG